MWQVALSVGLPRVTRPVAKIEPGVHLPAAGLTAAQRKAGQLLAARVFLVPVVDSLEMSAA